MIPRVFAAAAPFARVARSGALFGALVGLGLAIPTAAGNTLSPRDAFVVAAWLAAAFAVFCAVAASAVACAGGAVRRRPPRAPAEFGIAAAFAAFTFGFALRWFEFELAYPKLHSFVGGFGAMFAFASAFAVAAAASAGALGFLAYRTLAARRAGGHPFTSGFAGRLAAVMALVLVVVSFAARPDDNAATPAGSGASPASILPAETSMIRAAASPPRVLLLGCDGADPRILETLLAQGALPHLAALRERAAYSRLRTIRGRSSPAIWTSLATGCGPATHGIQDFYVQRLAGTRAPVARFPEYLGLNHGLLLQDLFGDRLVRVDAVNSRFVRRKPVWDVLAERGVSCAVVNWLVTWPADRAACPLVSERAQVAARGAAPGDSTLWRPASLADRFADVLADSLDASEDAFMGAIALRLLETGQPRFLAASFRDVDAAEHLHWREFEPHWFREVPAADVDSLGRRIPDAYVRFDGIVGALLAAAGPEAIVFVVSDHGHGPWFTWLGRGTSGGHTNSPDGIFLAAGPGIRAGPLATPPSCLDLAPTILHLFGLPVAEDLEGRVVEELFEEGSPPNATPSRIATYEGPARGAPEVLSSGADAEVFDRLKTLGYIR